MDKSVICRALNTSFMLFALGVTVIFIWPRNNFISQASVEGTMSNIYQSPSILRFLRIIYAHH